jgi:hypothetical protein
MWVSLLVAAALSPSPAPAAANRTTFPLADGRGEIEWISPCSFRVSRYWGRAEPPGEALTPEPIKVSIRGRGRVLRLATDCVAVEVERETLRIAVTGRTGPVLSDAAPPRRSASEIVVERLAPAREAFFGLGPRASESANLRGLEVAAVKPLLLSSLGYGEFFAPGPGYFYDLARGAAERRRVTIRGADRLQYILHYGPTPREILAEHARVAGTFSDYGPDSLGLLRPREVPRAATRIGVRGEGSWKSLEESVRSLVHASWSALLVPALDIAPYEGGPQILFQRAAQLGAVAPVLYRSGERSREAAALRQAEELRRQLAPYLTTCLYEAQQFGLPLIRPIAMQSPGDGPAAAAETAEFMLGDAILVAPVFSPAGAKRVYLPAGTWTDLHTNLIHKGRQTISIQPEANRTPLFAKHMNVLPLASLDHPGLLLLNYFAGGAAECLLIDRDGDSVSQFHAAPAGDLLRLEILSGAAREYEWVVRHAQPCGRVAAAGTDYERITPTAALKPGSWFYDPLKREIRIRCAAGRGEEVVLHLVNEPSPGR